MKFLITLLAALLSLNSYAHPGHGLHKANSYLHYLLDHRYLLAFTVAILLIFLGYIVNHRRNN